MKPSPIILLIDAERQGRRLVRALLEPDRCRVVETETGEKGITRAVALRPDVIILDLQLPDIPGIQVINRLREWYRNPIMVLSAQTQEDQVVAALDSGANDYVAKPFGSAELQARLRVLQRPHPGDGDGPFYIHGALRANVITHVVTIGGRSIDFTPTEEALFYILVRHAGLVVTCDHLLRCVWGEASQNKIHDLHVHIRGIRKKLRASGVHMLIHTEGSAGYRLLVPHSSINAASAENAGAAGACRVPQSLLR